MMTAYRSAYPATSLVVVNDAGDPVHERIAAKCNATHYVRSEHVGYPGHCHVDRILRWIRRLVDNLDHIKEPWFILLEDDVLVVRPVHEEQLVSDVNGLNASELLPVAATSDLIQRTHFGANVMKNVNTEKNRVAYGAMGGAIFRTAFFRALKDRWADVEADLLRFEALCPPEPSGQMWPCSDTCLSYLTYLYGGTIGTYADFTELWCPGAEARMRSKEVAVLNQYKHFYGAPFDA